MLLIISYIQITIQIASNCLFVISQMNAHSKRSNKLADLSKLPTSKKDYAKTLHLSTHQNQSSSEEEGDQQQDTMAKPLTLPKIKISFDEQDTKKIGWERGFSTLTKSQAKVADAGVHQAQKVGAAGLDVEPPTFQIPYNKKAEEIMNKKPLRQRLSGLLPFQMQLPISFDHQQIIKRMELVDRTIEFLETHRNMKVFFFEAIKKSIYQTSSVVIELKLIQQLLFLDSNCYQVEWRMNEKIRKYDIKIKLPKFQSMDLRKAEMRKKIVKFLILKQAEFLAANKLIKIDLHKWHEHFEYKKICIPEKNLPVHPHNSESDLRAFPDEQIEKVSNPALKMLLKKKKNVSQVKSLSSASVVDMIFSKVPACQISNQIFSLVREKEKMNNELKQKQKEEEKVDKQALLKIYDEILLIFMSKNVGNIFKVTLIQLLQQRLQLKNELISAYVEELLKMEGMQFLKAVQSSRKIQVVQIDKQRYREVRALVASKF